MNSETDPFKVQVVSVLFTGLMLTGGCSTTYTERADNEAYPNSTRENVNEYRHDVQSDSIYETSAGENLVPASDYPVSPQDQMGSSQADLDTLAAIRRAVVNDDSLSANAHNVKIMVRNGVVVLRGVVDSAREKDVVGHYAAAIGAVRLVNNELQIQP